ncbi:hypothetical protein VTJ49DRAFT_4902 [Mycothermus thermophilus]|uniref:F-box domain-containing protein n=1 Tax=Humicola insolens TaxID=85995 RepID=A0ABR3V490_HUMIN
MSAHILNLPNEILISITGRLPDLADLVALGRTCRRLYSVADAELFARIPRSYADVRHALFYFAENGLIESVRRLLDLGVDPNVMYCSPVPRDCLLRVLAAQGRRPGRLPLIDRKLVQEYITVTLSTMAADADLSESYRRLLNSPPLVPDSRLGSDDDLSYNFLLQDLHAIVFQHDVAWDRVLDKVTMADGCDPPTSLDSHYLWTPLYVAASRGDDHLDWSTGLLRAKPPPIEYALAAGHLQTVGRFLLERTAEPNMPRDSPERSRKTLLQLGAERHGTLGFALHFKRYSDALWLMDMGVTMCSSGKSLVYASLDAPHVSAADEEHLIPVLRRLISEANQSHLNLESNMTQCLMLAAGKHMPQTLRLLLALVEQRSLSLPDLIFQGLLNSATGNPDSPAAVETIKLLIDYGVAAGAIPLPTLTAWFSSDPFRTMPLSPEFVPSHRNLNLGKPGVAAAQLAIAQFIYERLDASPDGVHDEDLRAALLSVCQPGALPLCRWFASVKALRLVTKDDLRIMLFRTAMSERFGGNDPDLARWVLEQCDGSMRLQILWGCDVGDIICRSQGMTVAEVLLSYGAPPVPKWLRSKISCRDVPPRAIFSCRTRKRLRFLRFRSHGSDHAIIMACLRPDSPGAPGVLRHALAAEKEQAKDFVTNTIYFPPAAEKPYPLASLICCAAHPTGAQPTNTPLSEPQRLAMLKTLLAHGADVHDTLVECEPPPSSNNTTTAHPHNGYPEPGSGPSEPLWRALATGDEAEIARLQDQQHQQHHPSISENPAPPRWKLADVHRPVICAINSRLPSLVRLMLEEQPLTEPNSPAALRYLRAACSGYLRLCPAVLEIVLDKANIDEVDLPTGPDGMTALMCLMAFAKEDDFAEDAPDWVVHPGCRCEDELIGFEKDDLCNMIGMLVSRGAKWTTRSTVTGKTAGEMLSEVVEGGKARKGVYKIHVLEELRRRVRRGEILVEVGAVEGG